MWLASRDWSNKVIFWVSHLPGQEGKDWGYTTDSTKALPLSLYWAKRFNSYCKRLGVTARLMEVSGNDK